MFNNPLFFFAAVEFAMYLKYCQQLSFDEDPDYSYLRQIFRTLFERENFIYRDKELCEIFKNLGQDKLDVNADLDQSPEKNDKKSEMPRQM